MRETTVGLLTVLKVTHLKLIKLATNDLMGCNTMYEHLIDMFEKRYYKLDETYKNMLIASSDDNIKSKIKELIEYQESKGKIYV